MSSDGRATATVSVEGATDANDGPNTFQAFLKDDYLFTDTIWKSGEISVASNTKVNETYTVELWCDKRCKVVGPHGSTRERRAEIYAHVLSDDLESHTDEVIVECNKSS